MKHLCLAAVAAACLSACATTTPISKTERVGSSYSTDGISLAGKVAVAIGSRAFDADGRVGICAAIASVRGSTSYLGQATDKYKNGASFYLGGDRVARGAGFAPVYIVDEYTDIAGKEARCVTTDAPWKSSYVGQKVDVQSKISSIGS